MAPRPMGRALARIFPDFSRCKWRQAAPHLALRRFKVECKRFHRFEGLQQTCWSRGELRLHLGRQSHK